MMKDLFFTIGRILGVVTIFLCINFYYIVFFSITYFLSLIFIWISNSTIKNKIVWTILPIVLGYLYMLIIDRTHHLILKSKSLSVDYILPLNFTGEIIVFDNVNCGQNKVIENERIVIQVPENGIVYYSGSLNNEGYIDNVFRYEKVNITVKTLYESMFWEGTKEYHEQNYSENTIGIFHVNHYQFYNNKNKFKELFILTNKNGLDSINWYDKISRKLEKVDQINCN